MPLPTYNAAPLSKTFVLVRGLSLLAMLCLVGLTANFVSEIVSTNVKPPKEIVGTLSITCLATLYTLLTLPLFYSSASTTLLTMTALDSLLLIAFVVLSVVLGRPLSFLNCSAIAQTSAAQSAVSTWEFTQALASTSASDGLEGLDGAAVGLTNWAADGKVNCYESKAIWGLCVALCILFFTSASVLPILWWKARRVGHGVEKSGA